MKNISHCMQQLLEEQRRLWYIVVEIKYCKPKTLLLENVYRTRRNITFRMTYCGLYQVDLIKIRDNTHAKRGFETCHNIFNC